MSFKNEHILITAGPTWVPIDDVRVISNIATGKTGILLANELTKYGCRVTLVLGQVIAKNIDKKVKVIHFRFFDELKSAVIKELKSKKYDFMIHSAAVSDYKPKIRFNKKIKSGIKNLKLILQPTPKIINIIKRLNPQIFLVGFKFEIGLAKDALLSAARQLIKCSKADLVVANSIDEKQYKAYIISENKIYGPLKNREDLVEKLILRLIKYFNY